MASPFNNTGRMLFSFPSYSSASEVTKQRNERILFRELKISTGTSTDPDKKKKKNRKEKKKKKKMCK